MAMRRNLLALLLCGAFTAAGADWPQYRGDAAHSGASDEALPEKLVPAWTHRAAQPPQRAWPNDGRLDFDRTFQLVADGEAVYFGSSADNSVCALEASTGAERWRFFAAAPVRFAPVLWKDRILFASDDGHLYCLNAKDGTLCWSKRGGPDGELLHGNARMISHWPARGGPVLADDTVYFAAGIWPSDGVYLYALDPAGGAVKWVKDDLGKMVRGHPHQLTTMTEAGIGVQGQLAVAGGDLIVPTGRNYPAVYDRATGNLKYFKPAAKTGHATAAVVDGYIYNGRVWLRRADGTEAPEFGLLRAMTWAPATAGTASVFRAGPDVLYAIDRAQPELVVTKQQEKTVDGKKTQVPYQVRSVNQKASVKVPCAGEVIRCGGTLYCGGQGALTALDEASLKVLWTLEVKGLVLSLAAAHGRLYASTGEGEVLCFAAAAAEPAADTAPAPAFAPDEAVARAAEEILETSGVREGYCLDLDCGDGRLAYELTKRSKLVVYGIGSDAALLDKARRALAREGLYGTRVTLHDGDPAQPPYAPYAFDLIVSARGTANADVAGKLLRPWGGTLCLGQPGALKKTVRGALEGAGSWTHLYADAGNSICSTDTLARGPLRVAWFGGPDLDIPNRHGRPPGPLFFEGRLFALGEDALRALDAYTGRLLWTCELKDVGKPYKPETLFGVAGAGGDLCISKEGLFLRSGTQCLRLDPASGKERGRYAAPGEGGEKAARWSYLAVDGGLLFGSCADEDYKVKRVYKTVPTMLRTESTSVFAVKIDGGERLWTYTAKDSIRVNTLAVGGGRVYLIDRPAAAFDEETSKDKRGEHPGGRLVALDASSGKEAWNITENVYGTVLALSAEQEVLLMGYQPTRFNLQSEMGQRLAAFDVRDGKRLWDVEARYGSRPLINGDVVYASPGAWKLKTGEAVKWKHSRAYGCGILTGGRNLLLFRTGTMGYVDLLKKSDTVNYGGLRLGCWLNAIVAGGLVLVPDATQNCSCSYLLSTNVAMRAAE